MQSYRSSARHTLRTCYDCNVPSRRCLRTRGPPRAVSRASQAGKPVVAALRRHDDTATTQQPSRPSSGLDQLLATVTSQKTDPARKKSYSERTPPQSPLPRPAQAQAARSAPVSSQSSSGLDQLLEAVSSQESATSRKKPSSRTTERQPATLPPPTPVPAQAPRLPRASVSSSTSASAAPITTTPPTPDPVPLHTYPPPPTAYSSYTHSPAPNQPQLNYSSRFFATGRPNFLHSSAQFRTLPRSSVPEVAFLGRSNVGKSSLLNALVERSGVKIANVSGKPGRTRTMNAFGVGGVKKLGGRPAVPVDAPRAGRGTRLEERGGTEVVRREKTDEEREREHERWVGRGGLVVLDMPGYGKASREQWGKEIVKYLTSRKQLRRIFILIDSTHGLKSTDIDILRLLSNNSLPHQIVLTKLDRVLLPTSKTSDSTFLTHLSTRFPELCASLRARLDKEVYRDQRGKEIRMGTRASGDILGVSGEIGVPRGEKGKKLGVDVLRWEVLCAVGLECDQDGRARRVQAEEAGEEEWDEGEGRVRWTD